jgi:peptidoglycan/LPS O-acetylase OafA/YrhL
MSGMSSSATGRRLLLATVALIAANVICVFLAVSSDITPRNKVWGFDIVGFVPLPMMVAELILAGLAARDVRPPIGRVAAILLSVICLVSVLAGMFDGDMRNESMTSGSFWWGVVLIVLTAVVGLLAVTRARELRRHR